MVGSVRGELPLLETCVDLSVHRFLDSMIVDTPMFASFCLIVVRAFGSIQKGHSNTLVVVVVVYNIMSQPFSAFHQMITRRSLFEAEKCLCYITVDRTIILTKTANMQAPFLHFQAN